jgi:hypothetical protein
MIKKRGQYGIRESEEKKNDTLDGSNLLEK